MIFIKVNTKAIEDLNEGKVGKRINPVQTMQGDWVINSDILTDSQTWGYAFEYLYECEQIELTDNDFQITLI